MFFKGFHGFLGVLGGFNGLLTGFRTCFGGVSIPFTFGFPADIMWQDFSEVLSLQRAGRSLRRLYAPELREAQRRLRRQRMEQWRWDLHV